MIQTCGFCRSLLSCIFYLAFFYGFFKLGFLPFLLFLVANFVLVLAEWSSLVNVFSVFGIVSNLLFIGSMGLLFYYFYLFGSLVPALALYPFFIPLAFDLVTFLADQAYAIFSGNFNFDGRTSMPGFLLGLIFLMGANWYILNNYNPATVMNFPSTYFGIFGFCVLTSAFIFLGKLFIRKTKKIQLPDQEGCSIVGGIGFIDRFGAYLFFSYFIALISFGRGYLPVFITKFLS